MRETVMIHDTRERVMMHNNAQNIVVIGGGIIGCTSAYYLSRHPAFNNKRDTITLLEATEIAGGASGKAGGLLALWAYPAALAQLSFRLHRELADEHGGTGRWGYRVVGCGQLEAVGAPVARDRKDKPGAGENGPKERAVSLQKREKGSAQPAMASAVPADLDWIIPDGVKAYEPMSAPGQTAQVHPRLFTESMAALAQETDGVRIITGASVTSINTHSASGAVSSVSYRRTGDTSTAGEDDAGSELVACPATDVIVAAGPWTRIVLPAAPVSALRAHSVTIKPSRPVSPYALFTHIELEVAIAAGTNEARASRKREKTRIVTPEIYARPNDEVYACGEGDRLVPLPPSTESVQIDDRRCQDIVDQVGSISEELRCGTVTARQACYLPLVDGRGESGGPMIGRTKTEGLWLATGHSCWGVQNAPATGKLISELVLDGEVKSCDIGNLDPRKYF